MAEIDTSGLEDAIKRARSLENIPIAELVTDEFISKNTDFDSQEAFIEASGLQSPEDVGTDSFNEFVRNHTQFESWTDMVAAASRAYMEG